MRTARKFAVCLPILAVACFGAAPLSAQSDGYNIAHQLSVYVAQVHKDGFWMKDNEEGFFRVIVTGGGVEHVSNQLFIQMVKVNSEQQDYQVKRTIDVKELNPDHGHVLDVKTSFGDINAFQIDVTARPRGGAEKRYKISVDGSGDYQVKAQ